MSDIAYIEWRIHSTFVIINHTHLYFSDRFVVEYMNMNEKKNE
jgi:hypothetical protein